MKDSPELFLEENIYDSLFESIDKQSKTGITSLFSKSFDNDIKKLIKIEEEIDLSEK